MLVHCLRTTSWRRRWFPHNDSGEWDKMNRKRSNSPFTAIAWPLKTPIIFAKTPNAPSVKPAVLKLRQQQQLVTVGTFIFVSWFFWNFTQIKIFFFWRIPLNSLKTFFLFRFFFTAFLSFFAFFQLFFNFSVFSPIYLTNAHFVWNRSKFTFQQQQKLNS